MIEKPDKPKPLRNRNIGDIFRELVYATGTWFRDLLDLKDGMDREGTIVAIKNNKRMRGANAWLLMCSIMIASLGLDLNSPAIIIGAMLISPLMSPILGIGLGVGINDRDALIISLQHFGIAILIALITSTLYFKITPFGQFTDEIAARTKPTILDGLVAVFGGLAGIISVSRKDKSSAIPGVAIATALMPPLCVTGYGIATGNWVVMLNSFYLFFLNSFFVALTTYVIIRLLQFPFKTHVDSKDARRSRWVIVLVSLILIIPSANILFVLWLEQQDKIKVEAFVREYFKDNSETRVINFSLIKRDSSKQLILELIGKSIPGDSLEYYYAGIEKHGLINTTLNLIQGVDVDLEQINKLQLELSSLGQIADQLQIVSKAKTAQEREIESLRAQLESLAGDTIPFSNISQEAKILFPKLKSIGYAEAQKTDFTSKAVQIPIFMISWDRKKSRYERSADEKKLYEFLKLRARLDTLQIIPN